MNQPAQNARFGSVLAEHKISPIVRYTACTATIIFLLIWLPVVFVGIWSAAQGQVDGVGAVLSLIPLTAIVVGFSWFSLAVVRSLIQICDHGIIYQTAWRRHELGYDEIAHAIIQSRETTDSNDQIRTSHFLVLETSTPEESDVIVKPFLQSNVDILKLGLKNWREKTNNINSSSAP